MADETKPGRTFFIGSNDPKEPQEGDMWYREDAPINHAPQPANPLTPDQLAAMDDNWFVDAAMREIVEAVARAGADPNYGSQTTLLILCPGDDAETIRDKARALLGKE
jgi:hypothetical protein